MRIRKNPQEKISQMKLKTNKAQKDEILHFIKRRNSNERIITTLFIRFLMPYYFFINFIISSLLSENFKIQLFSKFSYISLKIKGIGDTYTYGNPNNSR